MNAGMVSARLNQSGFDIREGSMTIFKKPGRPNNDNFVLSSPFKQSFMKKCFFPAFLFTLLVSCGTTTKIIHSWRDPDVVINTETAHKFVFAALLKNETIRKRTEDLMTVYYPKKAIPSYREWGTDTLKGTIALYNDELKSNGIDAVVILRLIKIDKTHPYVHGIYPAYYNTWMGYYNYAWKIYFNPGKYIIEKTYYVEIIVYSLVRNKMVWTGITSTINPTGSDELFDDVINIINEKMRKEGFLQ